MIDVIISGCFHVEILMSYQVIAQNLSLLTIWEF